jgi:Ca2+-binding RTX toxin-like protein
MASAYYQAGTAVLDFTDLDAIEEVAYFDAEGGDTNPGASDANPAADTWSSYWYNGNIFANDIARGVDVFGLTGDPAAAVASARTFDHFNPQTQECLILDATDNGNDCRQSPQDVPSGEGTECANVIAGDKSDNKLAGTPHSDRISGKRGADRIRGRGGPDCLRGGSGADDISGGGGGDDINPGRGRDVVKAGGGNDIVNASRGGRDTIDCGPGDDVAVVNRRRDDVDKSCETAIPRSRADFATAAHLQSH